MFGPWECDPCGRAYRGRYQGLDTVTVKDPQGRRSIPTLVLLEYPPSDKPLRFLLRHNRSVKKGEMARDPEYGGPRYYFEEHSCPTNWLRNVCMVALDGDTDPHGFLRYVRDIDEPDIPDGCMEEDAALQALFPEMLSTAPITPDP